MEVEMGTKRKPSDNSSESKTFLQNSEQNEPNSDGTKLAEDSTSLSVSLTQVKPKKPERTGCGHYIGFLLAMGASLIFSLSMVIVKYLDGKIGPTSFGVYRFLGVMLSVPILFYYRFIKENNIFQTIYPLNLEHKENIKTAVMLLIRGFAGCVATLLQYSSVHYISIAHSATITFSSPIFVGLAAWIFLGEKCGVVPVLASLLTFAGVIVTAFVVPEDPLHDNTFEDHLIGASMAFASMIFAASVVIILRYLRRVHFSIVSTCFGITGLVGSSVACAVLGQFDVPHTTWEWCLVSGIGILTLFGQIMTTLALKFEDAGSVALIRTGDVVFSFVLQFVFLGVDPEIFSVIGAIIICCGVGLIALRKYMGTLPSEHKRRKTLAFILK